MQEFDYERLRFRRQYLLTKTGRVCPFHNHAVNLTNNYRLDYHVDLKFTEIESKEDRIILLGDVYDFMHPRQDNHDILKGCIGLSFDDLTIKFSKFTGRYVVIVVSKNSFKIFHDFASSRKIYFTVQGGNVSCSSNPHLLAQVLDISPTENPSVIRYYKSEYFKRNLYSNIGDVTYYDEIKQLLPNHSLDVKSASVHRFWPTKITTISKEECVAESAKMIRGFLHAAAARYPLMIPITAGYDSRLLLAAARKIKDKVFFYLNISDNLRKTPDYKVPQKMLPDLGLEFKLLESGQKADEQFREIYFNNNPFANAEFMDIIYHYWKHHPEKLNLPGNIIPVINVLQNSYDKTPTAKAIAKSYNLERYDFALEYYEKWLNELGDVCEQADMNLYNLLYLEERTCNWSTQLQQDKDIGQEELVIFNSGYLISLMLTYDETRRQKPFKELHKDLIRNFWPELLNYPLNHSFKNKVVTLIAKMKLLGPAIRLKRLLIGMHR